MTDRCIHGFETQRCASCRRCAHGLLETRCAVCSPPRTAREATIMLANDAPRPSEEHRGYEIHYVAGQRSWYVRSADSDAAPKESYGSAFQARRAIDRLLDSPQPVAAGKKKAKKA